MTRDEIRRVAREFVADHIAHPPKRPWAGQKRAVKPAKPPATCPHCGAPMVKP